MKLFKFISGFFSIAPRIVSLYLLSIVMFLVMFLVSACGEDPSREGYADDPDNINAPIENSYNEYIESYEVELKDGRTVQCVVNNLSSGITCDFETSSVE